MATDLTKKLIQENVWKNILVLVIVALATPFIRTSLAAVDEQNFGNVLLIISILLVTVCFANFAFTYKDSDSRSQGIRVLSHASTFLFLLLMALLLLTMSLGVGVAYPAMNTLFFIFSLLLYVGVVLYDFWDLLRTH